jgi:hypothetical protein
MSNEWMSIACDYNTNENVCLVKGQHVQLIQKINNDSCIVKLANGNVNESQQQIFEIPINILKPSSLKKLSNDGCKSLAKLFISCNPIFNELIFSLALETPSFQSSDDTVAQANAGASKRKGSFKKWLRASHRKLTSSSMSSTALVPTNLARSRDSNKIKSKVVLPSTAF